MRQLLQLFISGLALCVSLSACHPLEEYPDGKKGEFDALWNALDQHYCFFAEKDVDWNAVYDKYLPLVTDNLSERQFFGICENMVNELRDGHTNVSSPFATSYYRNWWSDYPQNFNLRIIEENYLKFEYSQIGSIIYGVLPGNVGYIYIPSFNSGLGQSNIDWILAGMNDCNGLIIDLRDNGGGSMNYAENWVRHFIRQEMTVGYMMHKSGPGHEDFADPYPIRFSPLDSNNYVWVKPVVLLTNRSTFSAANYMVMCMRALPNVLHAGATTGGGAGMPLTLEIPGGWSVRMSAVRVYDAEMRLTEAGIAPDEGCAIDLDPSLALEGRDTMLEFAIDMIK